MNLDFAELLKLDVSLFIAIIRVALICFASIHALAFILVLRQINLANTTIKTRSFGCILLFTTVHVILLFLILILTVLIAP